MAVPSRRELREAIQAVNEARAALNARIGTLVELVADIAVTLPETTSRHGCPRCGVEKPDQAALADHLELVHALARADAEREAATAAPPEVHRPGRGQRRRSAATGAQLVALPVEEGGAGADE